MIFTIRVTAGREKQVVDRISSRVKTKIRRNIVEEEKIEEPFEEEEGIAIYSILSPSEIRGYIFIEASSRDDVLQAVYGITHVRGVVKGEVNFDEVKHFFSAAPISIKINKGDIIEIISGPFKGEKAKVNRINKVKEEVVVELLEAAVPIPITVKLDSIRIVDMEKKENEESD